MFNFECRITKLVFRALLDGHPCADSIKFAKGGKEAFAASIERPLCDKSPRHRSSSNCATG